MSGAQQQQQRCSAPHRSSPWPAIHTQRLNPGDKVVCRDVCVCLFVRVCVCLCVCVRSAIACRASAHLSGQASARWSPAAARMHRPHRSSQSPNSIQDARAGRSHTVWVLPPPSPPAHTHQTHTPHTHTHIHIHTTHHPGCCLPLAPSACHLALSRGCIRVGVSIGKKGCVSKMTVSPKANTAPTRSFWRQFHHRSRWCRPCRRQGRTDPRRAGSCSAHET